MREPPICRSISTVHSISSAIGSCYERAFRNARFLVQPTSAAILESLLGGRPAKLNPAERTGYASEAASLLARIASQAKSPYAADLTASEPALSIALNQPETSLAAVVGPGRSSQSRRPTKPF